MMPSNKIHWKIGFITLFVLSLVFTACTQGQGPAQPDKVTVTGTETPEAPVDVCERPENLENILCQWVATHLIPASSGGGGMPTMDLYYDPQARITKMVGKDSNGNEAMLLNLVYDEFGISNMQMYNSPNPPDSTNYSIHESRVTTRDPQTGAIISVIEEKRDSGTLQSNKVTQFAADGLSSTMIEHDGSMNATEKEDKTYTKDPVTGKTTKIEEKEFSAATVAGAVQVGPQTYWRITEIFYLPNGRLDRMEMKSQNCPCGADMVPTSTQVVTAQYDEQMRMASFNSSETNNNQTNSQECELSYELQSKAKIAGKHPLEIFITNLGMAGFEVGFNERDLFSNFSCKAGGNVSPNMDFKWVRLWEALPEGKPPGTP